MEETEAFAKGMQLFREGNVRRALLAFEAEVQTNADSDEGWRMLGMCHAESDQVRKPL